MQTEMSVRAIPRQSVVWDEHRNSSRVFPVPPTAIPDALAALDRFRATQLALYEWVAAGAPSLTDAEHVALFGEPYRPPSRSRLSGGKG